MNNFLRSFIALTCFSALPVSANAASEINDLACLGDVNIVASGEKRELKRFSRRELTLMSHDQKIAITYNDSDPMEADITDSHYRVIRSEQSKDWTLILLDRDTLEVTISEFIHLPDNKHRSIRFKGKCKSKKPVA